MFRDRKMAGDAAAARFAAHRAKKKPGYGRVHVRAWPDEKLPATASLFAGFANTRSISLLGAAAQKRIIKATLGVDKVTANGLEVFSALLDKGVDWATGIIHEIHTEAVRRGANKKVFGTDTHMDIALNHMEVRAAPKFKDDISARRQFLSDQARERMNAMPDHKKQKKKNYQYLPSFVKTLYSKLNRVEKTVGKRIYTKSPVRLSLGHAMGLNDTARHAVTKALGELTIEGIQNIDVNDHVAFLSEDGQRSFFPAHKMLIGPSVAKWMSYETAVIIFLIVRSAKNLGGLFDVVLGRPHNPEDLLGFYKQYRLFSRDLVAIMGRDETTPDRLYKLQVAAAKALSVALVAPGGNFDAKAQSLANRAYIELTPQYFATVERLMGTINKANPKNVPGEIARILQEGYNSMDGFEEYFHINGTL